MVPTPLGALALTGTHSLARSALPKAPVRKERRRK
jgi:hypothetical protein